MTYSIPDFRRDYRLGQYAWPGGYPRFFVMDDGEALSWAAAKENRSQILHSIAFGINDGWRVVGVDINWEDGDLVCSHTNKRIETAYGDPS